MTRKQLAKLFLATGNAALLVWLVLVAIGLVQLATHEQADEVFYCWMAIDCRELLESME